MAAQMQTPLSTEPLQKPQLSMPPQMQKPLGTEPPQLSKRLCRGA